MLMLSERSTFQCSGTPGVLLGSDAALKQRIAGLTLHDRPSLMLHMTMLFIKRGPISSEENKRRRQNIAIGESLQHKSLE